MCNSDNEDDAAYEAETKPKNKLKSSIKIIPKTLNDIQIEKEEKAKRKRIKRLNEQQLHCLNGDKWSNEEDRITYEESSNIMV